MKRVAFTAGMLALVLAACGGDEGGGAPTAAAGPAVEIRTFIFDPDPVTVQAGETVTFTNRDATTHTVTAGTRKRPDEAAFDASLDEGASFEHAFAEPGEYDYFCDLHSGAGMVGKVIVE